jgi:hypothetical protein
MCFQNMLMLHNLTSDVGLKEQMLSVMHAYGDWAWQAARDDRTNLFSFDDAGRPASVESPRACRTRAR